MVYVFDPIIRDIPNFNNYQISENGEVYNKTTGNMLKNLVCINGYQIVYLSIHAKKYNMALHRVLGTIFLNIPINKKIIFKNGDKTDLSLDNLVCKLKLKKKRKMNNTNSSGHSNITLHIGYYMVSIMHSKIRYIKKFVLTEYGLNMAIQWRDKVLNNLSQSVGDFE